jgi:hypothetical protein
MCLWKGRNRHVPKSTYLLSLVDDIEDVLVVDAPKILTNKLQPRQVSLCQVHDPGMLRHLIGQESLTLSFCVGPTKVSPLGIASCPISSI